MGGTEHEGSKKALGWELTRGCSDSEAEDGLEEGDEVVSEIDIVTPSESFKKSMIPMVVQFPLRRVDAPYEGEPVVRFKHKVRRMRWELPLDSSSVNYYAREQEQEINSFTLSSSRVSSGVEGMAVGFMKNGMLQIVPLKEVMQMRPTPEHMDDHTSGKAVEFKDSRKESVMGDLQPITVQIKKHETEQQTEARLRSYAFHAQQDEADVWCSLQYHSADSKEAFNLMENMHDDSLDFVDEADTMDCESYLNEIVPSIEAMEMGDMKEGGVQYEAMEDMGKPTHTRGNDVDGTGEANGTDSVVSSDLTYESTRALRTAMARLFEESAVLSINKARKTLRQNSMPSQLKKIAASGSDDDVHSCIMSLGDYVFVRHAYVRKLKGDSILDPLRSVVLEVLESNEVVKRGDVMELASARGVAVTDQMYSRVMRELCCSKGSSWFMKPGD
jgi:DNA-directed RNA polymerase-3 subunit RPC5